MLSSVDIANIALVELGGQMIRSFDENNKPARLVNLAYPTCRDWLLSSYRWSFARKTRELSLLEETSPDWAYVYQLPSDCFTPFFISKKKELDNWAIEGKSFLCNINPCILRYVWKVTDTQFFTPPFIEALAALIKARIAQSLVQDKTLASTAIKEAIGKVRNAQEVDARLGNEYRQASETPELDSFVNPGAKFLYTKEYVTDVDSPT